MVDRVRALYNPGPRDAFNQRQGKGNTIFVQSRGRPTAPQTLLLLTCYTDEKQYMHRSHKHPTENTYPVGRQQDHDAERGELAFARKQQNYATQSRLPYDPRLTVFTSANGMDFGEDIMFVGTVDREWMEHRPSGDNAVTIRIFGTNSIMNTGDEVIQQGQPVIWDWPLCYKDGSGQLRNRLNIKGGGNTAAEMRSKFLFATRPYHLHSVAQIFKELGAAMRMKYAEITKQKPYEVLTGADGNPRPLSPDEASQLITYAKEEHRWYSFERSTEPAAMAGVTISAARVASMQKEANTRDPVRRFLGFVLASLGVVNNEYWNPATISMRAVIHERAMSRHVEQVRVAARSLAKRQRQSRTGNRYGGLGYDAASSMGIFSNQAEIDTLKHAVNNPGLYAEIVAGCCFDAYDLMQSRVIGKALSSCNPGQPFDVFLNKSVN